MKNFTKSLDSFKFDINDRIYNISSQLVTIRTRCNEHLSDLEAESVSKIKDSIIEVLPEETFKTSLKYWKIGESNFNVGNWSEQARSV